MLLLVTEDKTIRDAFLTGMCVVYMFGNPAESLGLVWAFGVRAVLRWSMEFLLVPQHIISAREAGSAVVGHPVAFYLTFSGELAGLSHGRLSFGRDGSLCVAA